MAILGNNGQPMRPSEVLKATELQLGGAKNGYELGTRVDIISEHATSGINTDLYHVIEKVWQTETGGKAVSNVASEPDKGTLTKAREPLDREVVVKNQRKTGYGHALNDGMKEVATPRNEQVITLGDIIQQNACNMEMAQMVLAKVNGLGGVLSPGWSDEVTTPGNLAMEKDRIRTHMESMIGMARNTAQSLELMDQLVNKLERLLIE